MTADERIALAADRVSRCIAGEPESMVYAPRTQTTKIYNIDVWILAEECLRMRAVEALMLQSLREA